MLSIVKRYSSDVVVSILSVEMTIRLNSSVAAISYDNFLLGYEADLLARCGLLLLLLLLTLHKVIL